MTQEDYNVATRIAYGKKLIELGKNHPNVVVMDADLSCSTQTQMFAQKFPERFINVGVAEQDLMATAAGLAHSGKIVFASTFTMFATGRAWEIVRNSIAYPKLNVKICSTHSGITVGEDGASHQSIEDIALMRVIPSMKVFVPADYFQTQSMLDFMVQDHSPTFLRLGRSKTQAIFDKNYKFQEGKGTVLKDGKKVCLFVTGFVTQAALAAAVMLDKKGISTSVVNLGSVKPIDQDLIIEMAQNHDILFSIEEHSTLAGFGSAIAEVLTTFYPKKLIRLGLQDEYGQSAPFQELLKHYRLDATGICEQVEEALSS